MEGWQGIVSSRAVVLWTVQWVILQPEVYFALCELCAKCAKYGKVRNFEGHFAQSVEGARNGLKFCPHLEKIMRSLNMQLDLCPGVIRESYGNKQHWNWNFKSAYDIMLIHKLYVSDKQTSILTPWIGKLHELKLQSHCPSSILHVAALLFPAWQHTNTEYRHITAYKKKKYRHIIHAEHTDTPQHIGTSYRDSILAKHTSTAYRHCVQAQQVNELTHINSELCRVVLGATSSNPIETWNVELSHALLWRSDRN